MFYWSRHFEYLMRIYGAIKPLFDNFCNKIQPLYLCIEILLQTFIDYA